MYELVHVVPRYTKHGEQTFQSFFQSVHAQATFSSPKLIISCVLHDLAIVKMAGTNLSGSCTGCAKRANELFGAFFETNVPNPPH